MGGKAKKDLFTIEFETERLLIRKIIPDDIEEALEHRLDEEVSQYTSDSMTEDEAMKFYEQRMKTWKGIDGEWLNLAILLKSTGKVIGEMGFNYLSVKHRIGEIGYRLNRNYQGKGYVFEAAQSLIIVLFDQHNIHKIMAICDPRNHASFQLMEKLGMKREAHFEKQNFRRGEWVDELWYGLLNPNDK